MSSQTLTRGAPRHARAKHARAKDADLQQSEFGQWKAPLLVIAAEVAVLGYLIRGSFFFADDYQAFGLAHIEGLGAKLLFTPGYGNLAPTERLFHWIPLQIAPLNYGLGEAIILVFTTAMLVALLWVLRELRTDPVVTLTAIFIVGGSTIVLYEVFDYDQIVFLFPTQACILCVIALFVRWTRTGSTRVLVAAWVVFGLSFFTEERVLIVPVYLVILRYLVLPYRMPPRGRRKPWADWRIWTPFAVMALAYYAYYHGKAEHSHPNYDTTFAFYRMAAEGFLRVLVGLPLQGVPRWVTPVEWLTLLAVLVTILVACRVKRRRKALIGATVYFVAAFAVNLFAVFQGVGGAVGISSIVGVQQYYLDPILALALAVGMVTSPLVSAADPKQGLEIECSTTPVSISLRSSVAWVCAAFVLLHIALLPFGMSAVLDSQGGQRLAASWVPTVRSSLSAADQSRTPTTILPLTMPAAFVPGFEAPFQLEQPFLPLLPEWQGSDRGSVKIIGPTGSLEPARALDSITLDGSQVTHGLAPPSRLSTHVNSNGDTCFTSRVEGGEFGISLPHKVSGGQIAVDIHLSTARPLTLTPFVVGPPLAANELPETVPAGNHRLVAALQGNSARIIGFAYLNAHADFCVHSIQVAAVGAASGPQADQCHKVDIYGSPVGNREPCGATWQ